MSWVDARTFAFFVYGVVDISFNYHPTLLLLLLRRWRGRDVFFYLIQKRERKRQVPPFFNLSDLHSKSHQYFALLQSIPLPLPPVFHCLAKFGSSEMRMRMRFRIWYWTWQVSTKERKKDSVVTIYL